MMLEGKVAAVHAAGGRIGGAVARAFAREGAVVHLSGRTLATVEQTAEKIRADGGTAYVAELDALDEIAVDAHAADVVRREGRLDVVLNAMATDPVQGVPLLDIGLDEFLHPVTSWATSQLLTSRAAARHMVERRSGTLITLSASPAPLAIAGTAGFGVACAAVEGMTRTLAAELGPAGVRVVCLRPHRIADAMGYTPDLPMSEAEFAAFLEGLTLLGRLPTLDEVGRTAAFVASDGAGPMTGVVADLTAGMSVR
ncbi:SDR family NAD(P)-dependent oxidoreductase [Mumia sp. Pv 4-285]|uniref:SDR family NAD(P)-dependent oxidoreductase n=1 Tax=Mumia qirimensis TaxID=3234852 RepID=UPI00351CDAB8